MCWRGDAQGRAVLHQADVVDVGHLRAADALVDPAHDIAEDALRVVVELVARSPRLTSCGPSASGMVSSASSAGDRLARQLLLDARTRRPRDSAARAASRRSGDGTQAVLAPACGCADLLREHVGHPVGRRPHALADLRPAGKPAGEADRDVALLIGRDPGRSPSSRPCGPSAPARIEVWISSPVRSRKPVLMNTMRSFTAWMQAARLAEVRRSSSITPTLIVWRARPSRSSTASNRSVGEGRFLGPVHLRLDDVDRAGAAVAAAAAALEVVQRDQAGDDRVEDAFGRLAAVGQQDRRVGHQMADIAHEQQAAAGQRQLAAVGAVIGAVRRRARGSASCRPCRSWPSRSPRISPSQLR